MYASGSKRENGLKDAAARENIHPFAGFELQAGFLYQQKTISADDGVDIARAFPKERFNDWGDG